MVRLAAELLLLLGLLLLTLHITVSRSSPLPQANATLRLDQGALLTENNINAKSVSTSAHLAPENRRPGTEHRSARRPSTLPWTRGSGGGLQHDGPGAFLLDLHNFPDLSKADINGQNPNIQVTIEVVDGLESQEPEKGLRKESKPGWPSPNWRNWWPHTSSSSSTSPEETPQSASSLHPLHLHRAALPSFWWGLKG
ncbi:isthmin-1 [Gadus macrocephalus]|uniref:isthmin-1 n=1 Tax=Gadus macrocephalus TaxID=80720 RepID=UPI0028CBBC05|nr:isthmin-1 [Gadus macrocephalus]